MKPIHIDWLTTNPSDYECSIYKGDKNTVIVSAVYKHIKHIHNYCILSSLVDKSHRNIVGVWKVKSLKK